MKKIFLLLLLCKIATSCNDQNKKVHFAEEPLQLSNFNFTLDIPYFFYDEAVFRNYGDIAMRAEEEEIDIDAEDNDGENRLFEYVRYGQWSSTPSIKVAAYKDFMFEEMVLCTDLLDEKTYLVGIEQDELTPADIDVLIKHLKNDLGLPTPIVEITKKNDNVSYEWYLDDKVVKLVLNIEREDEDKEGKLVGDWQRATYMDKENLKATVFLSTTEFDNALNKANSFTGMLVKYL